jgi:sulfatase modifying factor 1
MSGHKETGKKEGVDNSDGASMRLTRTSPAGILAHRVSRKVDLVNRLLQQEPAENSLPAGTLRSFGATECIWCPPGQFMMGSPEHEDKRRDDEVQHRVTLTAGFWISKSPTTQAEYVGVVGCNPSKFKNVDQPVETVSWDEAVKYCRKLTKQQHAEGIIPDGWEWRLPTEAEWEFAARAGHPGARYGDLESIAWYWLNADTPKASGWNIPNNWGLHDVIGNVSEWCSDWYGKYDTSLSNNPTGPSIGKYRVVRGDDCVSFDDSCLRFASRGRAIPESRKDNIGFRPVLSLQIAINL